MKLSRDQKIQLIKLLIFIVVFYLLARLIILPFLNSEVTQNAVQELGVIGYLIIIGYTIVSHVFAPVAGSPAVFLGITLYGPNIGMTLLYIASLISACINFWIARTYGREYVERFVGKSAMSQIDDFIKEDGKEVLAISRLLGFAIFDFISYAAGLTNISFKSYFVITAVCGLIPNLVVQLLLNQVNLRTEFGLTVWVASIVVAAALFGFLLKSYINIKNKRKKNQL
jgi:uncharacterized membrane protein YdjX (TVP38/TMEM64 family)